jgi:uncharacterized membrane protein
MEISPVILVGRWLHILSATLAVGVPIYIWLVQMPALASLDEENRTRLREAIAKKWRILVYFAIAVFLATGLYNYLYVARHKEFADDARKLYNALFGVKFLLALGLFFVLSALAGRSAALEYFRKNASTWIMVAVLLGLAIIGISGYMRFMK